ncbi:MAG TPA: tail fiber domain-containing protein [Pyrinomonadaceae bacterium]
MAILFCATAAYCQSTSFTYQGRLTDGGAAANGNYDLQFALFDSLSGGSQVGSTQTLNTVAVSNGVFTVSLDFSASAFNGANRFLQISARPSGGGAFTLLSPRQQLTSTPYAVRSLNATTADNVPASGVAAGSGNYIQNSTSPQLSSNFNISGNGTTGGTLSGSIVNATTQYNLGGNRVFSVSGVGSFVSSNTFAGVGAGTANTPDSSGFGSSNSFYGKDAGLSNTTGFGNSFFGVVAGRNNTTGVENSFFGGGAGRSNTTGGQNSFFGNFAGLSSTTGSDNAFFGYHSGLFNTTGNANAFFGDQVATNSNGDSNSFFGSQAAAFNLGGSRNAFFGSLAGSLNSGGSNNTIVGFSANVGSGNLTNASALGSQAQVDASNSLVLGSINGINGATADTNVGIGTTAPTARLSVVASGPGARVLHLGIERAWVFRQFGSGAGTALELAVDSSTNNNKNFVINTTGFVGIGTTNPDQVLSVNGNASKLGGGSWVSFSDERLKDIKGRFTPGLRAVMQLQPLRYEYKRDNALSLRSEGEHIGFSAQAVQKIIPEAVTSNDKGYLLVNNDPILWTMLNAIKEQQAQIATLQQANSALKARLHRVERTLRRSSVARRR